jgi:hypothetical protein
MEERNVDGFLQKGTGNEDVCKMKLAPGATPYGEN